MPENDGHDPKCPAECRTRLKILESFREDQTRPKDGFNAQFFEKLDRINGKLNWLGGGIAALAFIIMVCVAIFAAFHGPVHAAK